MPGNRIRKIFLYGISRGGVDGLLALRGILLAVFLGPEAFAAWVLFRLATGYFGFGQLGVKNGLEFFVARGKGPGGDGVQEAYWRSALGFVLLVFGTIAVAAVGVSFLVRDPDLILGLRWFGGTILAEQVWFVGLSFIRARGDLREYAIAELVNAGLQVSFAAALTPVFGLGGAFAGVTLATTLSLVLLSGPLKMGPIISRRETWMMLGAGFPILASAALGFMVTSVDRLIVAAHGDMVQLGLYGFAFSIAGIARSVATVLRTVVYPDVYASVPSRGLKLALRSHLDDTLVPFAWILPPVLGLLSIVAGPAIAVLLPEYTGAIPATRVLIFLGATIGLERLVSVGVVAAERQKVLPFFAAAALLLNLSLAVVALRSGLGLHGVAAAALLSNAIFGIGKMAFLVRLAQPEEGIRLVASVVIPLAWCVTVSLLVTRLRPGLGVSYSAGSAVLYVLFLLPLLTLGISFLKAIWSGYRSGKGVS